MGQLSPLNEKLQSLTKRLAKWLGLLCFLLIIAVVVLWFADDDEEVPELVDGIGSCILLYLISIPLLIRAFPAMFKEIARPRLRKYCRVDLQETAQDETDPLETMGQITTLCVDKTGVLTQNQLTVTKFWFGQELFSLPECDLLGYLRSHPALLANLADCVILGSEDHLLHLSQMQVHNMDDKEEAKLNAQSTLLGNQNQTANQTDFSLLEWMANYTSLNEHVSKGIKRIVKQYPFEPVKRQSSVIVTLSTDLDNLSYRHYFRGAAEKIVGGAKYILAEDGSIEPLSERYLLELLALVRKMAASGLRILALAYVDLSDEQLSNLLDDEEYETDYPPPRINTSPVLMGIIGIEEQLRENIQQCCTDLLQSGVTTRAVSGDHRDTAEAIAEQCHILYHQSHSVITGWHFKTLLEHQDSHVYASGCRVLARATNKDKELFIKWQQANGEVVASLGEGTQDVDMLKAADVSIALYISAHDSVKQVTHVNVLNDQWTGVVHTVAWGRFLFTALHRIWGFHMTVAIALTSVTIASLIVNQETALYSTELIWLGVALPCLTVASVYEVPSIAFLKITRPFVASSALTTPLIKFHTAVLACLSSALLITVLVTGELVIDEGDQQEWGHGLVFNSTFCLICGCYLHFVSLWRSRRALVVYLTVFLLTMLHLILANFAYTGVRMPFRGWCLALALGFVPFIAGWLLTFTNKGNVSYGLVSPDDLLDQDPAFLAHQINDNKTHTPNVKLVDESGDVPKLNSAMLIREDSLNGLDYQSAAPSTPHKVLTPYVFDPEDSLGSLLRVSSLGDLSSQVANPEPDTCPFVIISSSSESEDEHVYRMSPKKNVKQKSFAQLQQEYLEKKNGDNAKVRDSALDHSF